MDGIVNGVAGEALDGERRTVTALTGAACIGWGESLECTSERLGCFCQLDAHALRFGQVIAFGVGRLIRVSIRKQGVVLCGHEGQALGEEPVDIAHVASIFKR